MSLDLALRVLVTASLAILGAHIWIKHRAHVAAKLSVALGAGMIAYLWVPFVDGGVLAFVLLTAAIANPKIIWLISMALFRDGFVLQRSHLAIVAAAVIAGLGFVYRVPMTIAGDGESVRIISTVVQKAISLAFLALAVVESQRGGADDLVEPRRRVRRAAIMMIAIYAAIVAVVETALRREPAPWALEVMNLGFLFGLTLAMATMVLRHGTLLFALPSRPPPAPAPRNALHDKLEAWIREQGYLDPDVSVGSLAQKLATPEHTLRKLLNQELGFRNFRDFLHHHRIAEARRRLTAPDAAELPILNLSLDVGYRSLATFNRVFKAVTGLSPTAYREQHGPPPQP